jgi:hypothetical protein
MMSGRSIGTFLFKAWFPMLALAGLGTYAGLSLVAYLQSSADTVAQHDPDDADDPKEVAKKPTPLLLSEEQRQFLWDVEHHGNLLNKHGFKPLGLAISRNDRDAIVAALAPGFTGRMLDNPTTVGLSAPYASVVRSQPCVTTPAALDRAAFADRLLMLRPLFTEPPKMKFALMTLSPSDPKDMAKRWEGRARLRMWGERGPGQPAEVVMFLDYSLARPSIETFQKGGWLQRCEVTQSQVSRAPHFLMKEVARERGLAVERLHDNWKSNDLRPQTGGVFLCDFNRDGILDVLITDLNGYFLYQGLPGGTFRDVTTDMGLPRSPPNPTTVFGVAAFVDIDGDGWEDLILGNRIYRNENGRRFVDYTDRCNLTLSKWATGIAVADYDRDGKMDVYVTAGGPGQAGSWMSGKTGAKTSNTLWRNKGDWQFEDVTARTGTGGGDRSTFTAAWLDANNDGWPDLYVINEFGDGVLLLNNGNGTFREQRLTDRPNDFGSMGVTCGDIDNDGNIDIYTANMYSKAGSRVMGNLEPTTYARDVLAKMRTFVSGSELHLNRGNSKFEQVGKKYQVAAVGWAYGPLLVDLDNDGWLDLYATAGFISNDRNKPDG